MQKPDEKPRGPRSPRVDVVDETLDESFPASDPPAWSLLHAGAPRERSEERGAERTPEAEDDAP